MYFLLNKPGSSKSRKIQLEDTVLGAGGEGKVYKIKRPWDLTNHCVKLFNDEKVIKQKREKIQYMVNYPPKKTEGKNFKFCWPNGLVLQNNKIIGFSMPMAASNSISLKSLCLPEMDFDISQNWQNKYDRSTQRGANSRLKLCTNIANAIHQFHLDRRFVCVDLNPGNILVSENGGKISLIDNDSIQIKVTSTKTFRGNVAMQDYVPREGSLISPSKNNIPESWYRFSMAVLFYQILFGIHPYTASFTGDYEDVNTIGAKIKKSLFVHGKKKVFIKALPPPHNTFFSIPNTMQNLFFRAFEEANIAPQNRPSAEEWGACLYKEVWNGFELKIKKPLDFPVINKPLATKTEPEMLKKINLKVYPREDYEFIKGKNLRDLFQYTLKGMGLYYLDEHNKFWRKHIYFSSVFTILICLVFLLANKISDFSYQNIWLTLGLVISLVVYVIGIFDALILFYYYDSKSNKKM